MPGGSSSSGGAVATRVVVTAPLPYRGSLAPVLLASAGDYCGLDVLARAISTRDDNEAVTTRWRPAGTRSKSGTGKRGRVLVAVMPGSDGVANEEEESERDKALGFYTGETEHAVALCRHRGLPLLVELLPSPSHTDSDGGAAASSAAAGVPWAQSERARDLLRARCVGLRLRLRERQSAATASGGGDDGASDDPFAQFVQLYPTTRLPSLVLVSATSGAELLRLSGAEALANGDAVADAVARAAQSDGASAAPAAGAGERPASSSAPARPESAAASLGAMTAILQAAAAASGEQPPPQNLQSSSAASPSNAGATSPTVAADAAAASSSSSTPASEARRGAQRRHADRARVRAMLESDRAERQQLACGKGIGGSSDDDGGGAPSRSWSSSSNGDRDNVSVAEHGADAGDGDGGGALALVRLAFRAPNGRDTVCGRFEPERDTLASLYEFARRSFAELGDSQLDDTQRRNGGVLASLFRRAPPAMGFTLTQAYPRRTLAHDDDRLMGTTVAQLHLAQNTLLLVAPDRAERDGSSATTTTLTTTTTAAAAAGGGGGGESRRNTGGGGDASARPTASSPSSSSLSSRTAVPAMDSIVPTRIMQGVWRVLHHVYAFLYSLFAGVMGRSEIPPSPLPPSSSPSSPQAPNAASGTATGAARVSASGIAGSALTSPHNAAARSGGPSTAAAGSDRRRGRTGFVSVVDLRNEDDDGRSSSSSNDATSGANPSTASRKYGVMHTLRSTELDEHRRRNHAFDNGNSTQFRGRGGNRDDDQRRDDGEEDQGRDNEDGAGARGTARRRAADRDNEYSQ